MYILADNWIAVCTDQYNVRLFSLGGMQFEFFSIPGPVVAMASHTDQLIIVYHAGQGMFFDYWLFISIVYKPYLQLLAYLETFRRT